jgi:hypothetical protein
MTTTPLNLALQLARSRISVIPIRADGSKAPDGECLPKGKDGRPTWTPFQRRIAEPETLQQWYGIGGQRGIAAIGGAISGNLEDLDNDAPELAQAWRDLVERHEGGASLLAKLVIVETPSGGWHFIYRCSAAVSGNRRLARRPGDPARGEPKAVVIFETRGEGGYFILPGSPPACHITGRPYVLKQGSLTDIPVITPEEREILLSCARAFDAMPAAKDCTGGAGTANGDRPGDDFNRRAAWDEILTGKGWNKVGTREGITYWRRPAKGIGVSATTNWKGRDRLKVFSTSTEFETETTYNKFAAYAVLNHSGDFKEAAKALAAAGYGGHVAVSAEKPPGPGDDEIEREERDAIQQEGCSSLCPGDHFLKRWIEYAGMRTDAAREYHEAAALVLLAGATPNVRARLAPYPRGLPTNLYALMIGDSTTSRKSTSESFARDAQGCAMQRSLCADHFSPEGFVEQLASRPNDSTTLYVDEFGELLAKLHHAKHMAGLRGLLLTVYAGEDYTYRRHSKTGKHGVKIEDKDHVRQPHLSIFGATTPAIFDMLVEEDIISGLLPRFAIVMPEHRPPRRPFYQTSPDIDDMRYDLIMWISRLHEWATDEEPPTVSFQDGVLAFIDDFAAALESESSDPQMTDSARAMLQRLTPMAVKLSMLVAAGHPHLPEGPPVLDITMADAEAGIVIARQWQQNALRFAARIGESNFERVLQRCLRIVLARGPVRRGVIARVAHVESKILDAVRDTLIDRELVLVTNPSTGGRSGEIWHGRNSW